MDDIIGTPHDQLNYWEHQEQMDNCAVVAEMSIINQFGHNLTQDEANYISSSHGWYHPGGGTSPADIGNMMDLYNIPNHTVQNATLADLASELQAGHGVIVGVHSSELWDSGPLADLSHFLAKAFGLDNQYWNPADHAVVVTGIDVSDPDHPMVILNDSGHPDGAGAPYPLDQFMDAWENSGFYYTATNDALPGNNMDDFGLIDFGKWFAAVAATGATFAVTVSFDTALDAGIATFDYLDSFFADDTAIQMI